MGKKANPHTRPVMREMNLEVYAPHTQAAVLRGPLFALDHLRGSSSHAVSGVLKNQQGIECEVNGTLRGVTFGDKKNPVGRPPKDMRDIAVFMAFQWFAAGRDEAKARSDLLNYWQERWAGMPDESTRNTLIRQGRKKAWDLMGGHGDMVLCRGGGGCLLIVPQGCITQDTTRKVLSGSGDGLVWQFGHEESDFYNLRFNIELKNPLVS